MKLLPIVVVGLLLLSAPLGTGAMVPASGTDTGQPADNTAGPLLQADDGDTTQNGADGQLTNVLSIPENDILRDDLRRHHADLGPAADFDSAPMTDRLETAAIERELETADSATAREQQLEAEVRQVEQTVQQLEERQANVIQAFAAGDLEPRELLIELAAIDRAATALDERAKMLADHAAETESDVFTTDRRADLSYDIEALSGPVREYAALVLAAERPADRIYVEASAESLVLSAIDGDQYLREAYRFDLREPGTTQLSNEEVETIVVDRYPLLWEQRTSFQHGPNTRLSVQFANGMFETYVDPNSQEVIIDHQRLPLDFVVASDERTKTQDGLTVTVRQTYSGGPLQIHVADANSDASISAPITIGQNGQESETVGQTNEDGLLWTVTPRGPFTITVFGEGNSAAFVDVTPQEPAAAIE